MSDTDRVWEIAKHLDYCMFVTRFGQALRARPMSTVVNKAKGHIYLLTNAGEPKELEIAKDPAVLLAYSNGSDLFLSVSGTALITADRALVKDIWSPGAQAFWPEGPDDPNVAVINVTPHSAESWDGDSRVLSTVKFAVALATGTVPSFGENKKVSL